MNISGASGALKALYEVSVQKMAQDQQKVEGEAAVALISGAEAAVPPPGPEGQGSRVNLYG